jgi:hypothetical protein
MGQHSKAPRFSCPIMDKQQMWWPSLGGQTKMHPSHSTQTRLDLLESITVTWLQLLGKPAPQLMPAAVNPTSQLPTELPPRGPQLYRYKALQCICRVRELPNQSEPPGACPSLFRVLLPVRRIPFCLPTLIITSTTLNIRNKLELGSCSSQLLSLSPVA